MSNIDIHTVFAQDDLRDIAGHFGYWLPQNPTSGTFLGSTRTARVAATAAINTTETVIINAPLVLPSTTPGPYNGTLFAATRFHATLLGTTTSTNADVSTFTIRMGTAGTTADASVATATTTAATGTGIAFRVELFGTIRTLGATGTLAGSLIVNNTGVTGLSNAAVSVVPFTSAAVPTTTATFFDVTYVSAATTTTTTFQVADLEIVN